MYELRISAFEDFEKDFAYIKSSNVPRVGEIIEKFKIYTDDLNDDDKTIEYYWTLEVQSVHYELFEDKSVTPVVYANVIKSEIIGGKKE